MKSEKVKGKTMNKKTHRGAEPQRRGFMSPTQVHHDWMMNHGFKYGDFMLDKNCSNCKFWEACKEHGACSAWYGQRCKKFVWLSDAQGIAERAATFTWRGIIREKSGRVVDAVLTDNPDYMKIVYLDAKRRGLKPEVEQLVGGLWQRAHGRNISEVKAQGCDSHD